MHKPRVSYVAALCLVLAGVWLAGPPARAQESSSVCDLCYGGLPVGAVSRVLLKNGFVIGYSEEREDPLWICYRLFAVPEPVSTPRPSRFSVDRATTARVSHDDYTGSGYDRGHMAPNASIAYCYGREAQLETFLMSNVCPQTSTLNRGLWRGLEDDERNWADAFEAVWVITGPVFDAEIERLASGVEIPDAFYKIIVDETDGAPRVLAFIVPQTPDRGSDPAAYLVSVDVIEHDTGFDFLFDLPDAEEAAVESTVASQLWVVAESVVDDSLKTCVFDLGDVDAVGESITVRNVTPAPQELSGWSVSDGEGTYTFPDGVTVPAGATHTITSAEYNPTRWSRGLLLNNEHDEVSLNDPNGRRCADVVW